MAERNDEEQDQRTTLPEDTVTSGEEGVGSTGVGGSGTTLPTDWEAQLQAAREEVAQYKDKYLRELAEMENFRKRQERNALDRAQRYKRDLIEKVLEVMDNLDRAMGYEDSMDRESLQQGLRMVQWQLNELLRTEGLTPVPTVGEQFDPHLHEAVDKVPSSEHPEGTVVEEVRKGYMMGSDLLRPARVMVSAGSKE
ncbi:MAG: nucleotide exchange factor GrpE [Ktedonobacterales bacterium]